MMMKYKVLSKRVVLFLLFIVFLKNPFVSITFLLVDKIVNEDTPGLYIISESILYVVVQYLQKIYGTFQSYLAGKNAKIFIFSKTFLPVNHYRMGEFLDNIFTLFLIHKININKINEVFCFAQKRLIN